MKGSEVYNDLQEMVSKSQLEKRSGVIILTPIEWEEKIKKIAGDAFDAGGTYELDQFYNQYTSSKNILLSKTEYLNQLINP